MNTLSQRRIVLTGAAGGIGEPLTAQLVQRGAQVLAVGRNVEALQVLAQRHGGRVQVHACDVADDAQRRHLVQMLESWQPDTLVLGHAVGDFGWFEDAAATRLRQLIDTNLTASLLLVHAVLPVLQARPRAAVVAIGSTFGSLAFPGYAAYSASKFGLRGLFEALAREHADGTVHFQYLSPRATRTSFNSGPAQALNRALHTTEDDPVAVAAQLADGIARGDRRRQLGWPEKLLARLNGVLPALVDSGLRGKLPIIRQHARPQRPSTFQESSHASTP